MQGIEAYHSAQKRTEVPRVAEHRRLAELTAALLEASKNPADAQGFALAVVENQRFWSRLRINVLNANTSLPAEMRGQFVELASWVERESMMASTGESPLDHLIAVNQQMMEGLRPFKGSVAEDTIEAAE